MVMNTQSISNPHSNNLYDDVESHYAINIPRVYYNVNVGPIQQIQTNTHVNNNNNTSNRNNNNTNINCLNILFDVFSPTYRKVLRIVFCSSIVIGWILSSIIALSTYSPDDINSVCKMEIWHYLLILTITNTICLSLYVYTWYKKTFSVYDVNSERYKNNHRLGLYFIIIIQVLLALCGSYLLFNMCVIQSLRYTLIYNVILSWIIIIVVSIVLMIIMCGFIFGN